ncbi:MAG: hypothetical protein II863_02095, partial [Kiritimatiellae bacterium]|nr:hypothetical protein [Kiritimatiellia bacterium]
LRSGHERRFPERRCGTRGFLREIDDYDFFRSRSALPDDNWPCRSEFRFGNRRFNDRRGRRHLSCGDCRRTRVWRDGRLNYRRRYRRGGRHWNFGDGRRARGWRDGRDWRRCDWRGGRGDNWLSNNRLFSDMRLDNWRDWRDGRLNYRRRYRRGGRHWNFGDGHRARAWRDGRDWRLNSWRCDRRGRRLNN